MLSVLMRPIIIGMGGGLLFCLCQNKIDSNFSKEPFYKGLLWILYSFPIAILVFYGSLNKLSVISSYQTYTAYNLLCFAFCIISSGILFGFLRLPSIHVFNKRSGIYSHFIKDLNFYWFLINAYMISRYYDADTSLFLLVAMGFLLAITLFYLIRT